MHLAKLFSCKLLLLNDLRPFMLTQDMHPGRKSPSFAASLLPSPGWLRLLLFCWLLSVVPATISAQQLRDDPGARLAPIRSYISSGWNTLSRSLSDCATFSDSKLTTAPQLYLPADFPVPE